MFLLALASIFPLWLQEATPAKAKADDGGPSAGGIAFPIGQKLFDVRVRATGQTQPGAADYQPAVDA